MVCISLYDYQIDAIKKLHNGSILCGGVGSGKSRTSLAYYYLLNGGKVNEENYVPMHGDPPMDLYIITTARKRDTLEWEGELAPFLLSTHPGTNYYKNKVIVDSWNNIKKYTEIKDAFFIFDEQRVVGNGTWVKSFLKICKSNRWILLSATPGDTWSDYIPVFLANGFYRNRSEFTREHVVYSRFTRYPKVDRYINTGRLVRLRNKILVNMDFKRSTVSHHEDVWCDYDQLRYKQAGKDRWDPYKDEPIRDAGSLCYIWRRIVNSDPNRQCKLLDIFDQHPKMIVFYNFDYELDILKGLFDGFDKAQGNLGRNRGFQKDDCLLRREHLGKDEKDARGSGIYAYDEGSLRRARFGLAEWNGHKHQEIPDADSWVYLVQYTAGCEGWNCVKTDTIVFYSQNYSYKVMQQAAGRIDRLNTPFTDLYYYHMKSRSGIDLAISKALSQKKKFNEGRFVKW